MAAAAFWKVHLYGTLTAAEVVMRETVGGANAAASATLTSSGITSGTVGNLVDGNPATEATLQHSEYVGVLRAQFSAPVTIVEFGVRLPAAGAGPVAASLWWSADGIAWTPQAPVIDLRAAAAGALVVASGLSASGLSVAPGMGSSAVYRTPGSPLTAWGSREPMRPWGGTRRILGTVGITGSPDVMVRRRVTLLHEPSRTIAAETWSAEGSGAYAFEGLDPGPYSVWSDDHPDLYNSVMLARVSPVP